MTRYIIRRSIQSFFLLWLATIISFSTYQMAPGGPLQFLDDDPNITSADFTRLERSYGIDRSILVQYFTWVAGEDWTPQNETWRTGRCLSNPNWCGKGILRLDFGRSFAFKGESAISLIAERIPATFLLAASSFVISIVGGIPLGILAAIHRGRWPDHIIRIVTVLLSTVPAWWIGLISLMVLGGWFNIVPLNGMQTIGDGSLLDRLHHLVLPATVSAIGGWISFSRIMRFEMLEVLNADYVRTAYAKGLSQRTVIMRHVLRNALMPFVTGMSGIFLLILSGSILFELVFSWPGMGRLAIMSINSRDYPVMMALLVVSSFLGIMGVLIVDILYSFVDPRVKYDITR